MIRTYDGFTIDVIEKKSIPMLHVLKVLLKNDIKKTVKYNMNKVCSPHGVNMLDIDTNYIYEGIPLLNQGELQPGENITGIIVLQKNYISTMNPFVFYDSVKIL